MPDDKEKINEGMGMGADFKEPSITDDLDTLESKIDEVNKMISPDRRSIRPPLTNEQKIKMLDMIFPIHLGDKIKNKHGLKGYVTSVSIDHRGVLYLIEYPKHETHWETEYAIEKISSHTDSDTPTPPGPIPLRTDIPDEKA